MKLVAPLLAVTALFLTGCIVVIESPKGAPKPDIAKVEAPQK